MKVERGGDVECACCGKPITKIAQLNTGHLVGTDCAEMASDISFRLQCAETCGNFAEVLANILSPTWYRLSRKRLAFLRSVHVLPEIQ